MRHVILGTAGHIDHGKSSVVKALTGVDPDRLKEEKERGITIELGFAELHYPEDDLLVGIVDVPGHERLVKNMLAGAGGIDLVLMVIAADEGIMPQSREHLAICDLLNIRGGIIAITKSDLVEPDWLELVTDEVRELVKDTFLEGAEILPVSSTTGENVEALKVLIRDAALDAAPKPEQGIYRLPVDRVFTLKGFGTVVTGTSVSGTVSIDEQVEVLPSGLKTKVRGLQSHGKAAERAYAGQRTALNLQGVEKEELNRGDVVVTSGRFAPTSALDVRLELLSGAVPVKTRSEVHFHLGTSETVARVVVYEGEVVDPGSSSYCQLRLSDSVVAQAGDRFVIRRISPLETLGGGVVLDATPRRRKKRDSLDDLKLMERGTLSQKIGAKVYAQGMKGFTALEVEGWIKSEIPAVKSATSELVDKGVLLDLGQQFIHKEAFDAFGLRLTEFLEAFHDTHPTSRGIPKEEAREKLKVEASVFTELASRMDNVTIQRDLIALKGFTVEVDEAISSKIIQALEEAGVEAPQVSTLAKSIGLKDKQLLDILKLLASEGRVVRANDSLYLGQKAYDKMVTALMEHFKDNDSITVAEFRDLMGTTRKYALPLLEFLDATRVTVRVDDVRKLLKK